ncbi:MAG: heavy metal-responsive transcriptional regulator [Egibacteraceae bacterium]
MLIGELARATGVTAKTLRYYEDEELLHEPDRTPGGYRDYAADVVARVEFIRRAQAAGLTLRQIHAVLTIRDDGQAPCVHVAELVTERLADVEQRLRELRQTRAQLRQLQHRLEALDPARCQPTSICSAIQPAGSAPPSRT